MFPMFGDQVARKGRGSSIGLTKKGGQAYVSGTRSDRKSGEDCIQSGST